MNTTLLQEALFIRYFGEGIVNVISLFNGFIPLIAVQMNAIKMGTSLALVFTTVLDQLSLGFVEEDEEAKEVTDRAYWENRGTKASVAMADRMLDIIHSFDHELELKYNKFYIGLAKNDQTNNFTIFKPQKNGSRIEVKLTRTDEVKESLEEAGLDFIGYDSRSSRYRIRLIKGDIKENKEKITELLKQAYDASIE